MSRLSLPYRVGDDRRTATSAGDRAIRERIEAVLFTAPGERVNRPDFGCGLRELVFAGNEAALAAGVELTVQGALQRWLGEEIEVRRVAVAADDATLAIDITYAVRRTGEVRRDRFPAEA